MCQMTVSQRRLEAERTHEELPMISESCLMSWLVLVMTLLVDCCSKCLQRKVGRTDCWTTLTEGQQLNWLLGCLHSGCCYPLEEYPVKPNAKTIWSMSETLWNSDWVHKLKTSSDIFTCMTSVLIPLLSSPLPHIPFSSFFFLPCCLFRPWTRLWMWLNQCAKVCLMINVRRLLPLVSPANICPPTI